ncbi:MAG: hypothetical protein ABIH50_06640 [bacterium]
MSSKKLKAQLRIFKELETQLMLQADRVGIKDRYESLSLRELEGEALQKHLVSFYQERSNLEYEMQLFGTNKKETLIKLERLESYIKRAERMAAATEQKIKQVAGRTGPDQDRALKATAKKGISYGA